MTVQSQDKLVDHAIVTDWNKRLRRRITHRLNEDAEPPRRQIKSTNCISASYIRFNPIAITIKTRPTADGDSANLDLGTWAIAHLRKLMRLTGNDKVADLPVLPVIFIDAHTWYLMLARLTNYKFDLFGRLPLGDTWTLIGTYKMIASVQRLARWIEEEYRPWFDQNVIPDKDQFDDAS